MRTYRELFRAPEFTSLFLVSTLQVAGQTVSGLALGTLIYGATGSPLLSSLAMFGPSLAQLVGATTLLSAADRLPPRATLGGLLLVFAAGTAVQALPGLPVAVAFAVLLVQGVLASLGGGVRYGLLNEVLSKDGYLLGRSVLNMSTGIVQICGYALGGVLVALLEPRGTLLAGAALYLAGAVAARLGLGRRPPRATGRVSVAATWRTNALLWSSRPRRLVYLALWVPNGLVVGCESLYVPYAPHHAGLLFACGALGMLAGDTAMGRFVPAHWRRRLPVPMLALLAAPFLLFALRPPLPVAAGLVTVATVGFAASLLLQERLLELTPHELSGHALGLHSSGMLAMQGVGAALAGAVAERTSPATAMTLVGAASLAVTAGLARGLLAPAGHPQPAAPPASTPAAPAPARPPQEPEGRP
ncbi:MFS transporter [Streptomyces albus]|uniref:MFS transporter n=2 Tax=Streptomyces albus TaxID=1888 RepID=A0A6C1C689_9ACTN|nr:MULTISPECIES: MFS transporter [Streptomyces]QID37830.1 MFS transporter [Streptomyces albus]TGG75750.1 MFS transporter [Streptomyces albus]UVN55205.1 MFS transporter [Streptomyces albus]